MKTLILTLLLTLTLHADDTNQPPVEPKAPASTNAPAIQPATLPAPPTLSLSRDHIKRLVHLGRLLAMGQMDERGNYDASKVANRLTLLIDATRFEQKQQENMREYLALLELLERATVAGKEAK